MFRRTRSAKAAPQPAPRFRPRVEGLEDRLTPSGGGLLDPTFGSGGIVNLPHATDFSAAAVVVQPDGKVVIAGQVLPTHGNYTISVQRLNRDGSLDTTFNKTGSVTIPAGSTDNPTSVALQPDGKILVGGIGWWKRGNGGGNALVARLNANGSLDTTFGSQGLWESTAAGGVSKLAVLTNATHTTVTGIVAAAMGTVNGTSCFEAIKLTPAGVPDKSFGSGGFAAFAGLSGADGSDGANSVAVAPSGEIYLAGRVFFAGLASPDGCIAAVTSAGALDTTFGSGSGYVLADPTGTQQSEFFDVAVQTLTVNGQAVSRLIASGYFVTTPGGSSLGIEVGIAAYTLGGALDTSFGSGGWFMSSNPNLNAYPSRLTLEADGSIVVTWQQGTIDANGVTTSQMVIGHLTADGTADTSFGSDGTGFVTISDGIFCYPNGVAIDPTDGNILVCGYTRGYTFSTNQAVVVRLTAP